MRRGSVVALAGGVAAAFAACADAGPGEAPTASARRPIVNGAMTTDFATTGILLEGGNPARLVCSGTLIACDRFLTAAHCVCGGGGGGCQDANTGSGLKVYLPHAGFVTVLGGRVHPDYDFPAYDVAVLRLGRAIAGVAPSPIASAAPALGTSGTIVGFGRSGGGGQDYGIKQTGEVVTGECPADASGPAHVCWRFEGDGANTCNGDSGGPLLVERDGALEVAGITSGGTQDDCLAGDRSYDQDVFAVRDFVADAVGGEGPGGPACGALPAIGDDGVVVATDQGELAAGGRALLDVEVPPATAELRLTFNATEGAAVDLRARVGGAPDAETFDCAAAGASSYGACVIAGPAHGTWTVAVDASDAARYQLTAIVISGGAAAADDDYVASGDDVFAVDAAGGVLANDAGEGLAAELVGEPRHGVVELAADGSFRFEPEPGYVGDDRFTYRAASAGDGAAGGATVRLTIEPVAPDAGVGDDGGGDGGGDDGGCGCGASGGSPGGLVVLLAALATLASRRRRYRA